MSFDKDFFRPLGIFAFTILILMVISEWIPDYEDEYIRIRAIHFITGKEAAPVQELAMAPGSSLQDQIVAEALSATKKDNYYNRSSRKPVIRKGSPHKEKNYIQEPEAPPPPLVYDSNPLASLRPFFDKLSQNVPRGRPVRIAFYGDSIIEGDLITEELRKQLQDRFGGQGVGMVPITSIVAGFRVTIRHSFSGQWNTYSLMNRPPQNIPLGISGFAISGGRQWQSQSPLSGYPKF